MKDKVYLVGQISVDVPETYQWRKRVRTYFMEDRQFEFIDPCKNEFNQSVVKQYGNGTDIGREKVYKLDGIDLLVPKDKMYVMKSTIAIANMNVYDHEKPLVGTFFELAWYHTNNHKSVIGIFDGDRKNDRICNHPFVRSVVNCWVKDEQQACKVLEKYFRV